jgi:hypothetical protein
VRHVPAVGSSRTALSAVAALVVIALPVATALAVILTAPSASARSVELAKTPGHCQPSDQPCGSAHGGTGIGVGISVTVGGLTACSPSGVQISTGVSIGGSLQPWVPFPCPVPAAAPAPRPTPTRTRPASSRPRPQVTVTPVPAPVTAPAVVTQVAPVSRPHRPRPRPHRATPRPAAFLPAPEGLTAEAYTPGRPVMPIGVLITVVLTPCVLTVAARLGKLLSGR